MATRMVVDCNRCGKENVKESHRLDVLTTEGKKRVDLCTKCLGAELQGQLNQLQTGDARNWYERINKRAKRAGEDVEELAGTAE